MSGKEPARVARELIGSVAPKLAELTETVVFDDIWERPGLSKRDRSMITVAALVALNRPEQLRFHIEHGLENGVSREELGEMITHLAIYCGWPSAMSAAILAKEVFKA